MAPPIRPAVIPPALLVQIGTALYGGADQWKAHLSDELGGSPSIEALKQYVAGTRPIHASIASDLRRLVARRAGDLAALVDELDAALAPPELVDEP